MNRIKAKIPGVITPDDLEPSDTTCPNCGISLTQCVGTGTLTGKKPAPGDLSICAACGEPCEYGENEQLIKLGKERYDMIKADPEFQKAAFLIKSMVPDRNEKAYSDQLDNMADAVRHWKSENIALSPMIQYNFPEKTAVIAAIEDAIEKNFISINEDARTMFQDLGWLDDKPNMPTVLMVKAVLDHVFGGNDE